MSDRSRWLFWVLVRQPLRTLVPERAYYWLLDRLTDNNGWRPLHMRYPEHFRGGGKP